MNSPDIGDGRGEIGSARSMVLPRKAKKTERDRAEPRPYRLTLERVKRQS
jgi:hypothetical protein